VADVMLQYHMRAKDEENQLSGCQTRRCLAVVRLSRINSRL